MSRSPAGMGAQVELLDLSITRLRELDEFGAGRARETTHAEPTFLAHDVIHYAVGNMPGGVPCTSTQALANATLPYLTVTARDGLGALETMPGLVDGVNTHHGAIVNASVAEALGRKPGRLDA